MGFMSPFQPQTACVSIISSTSACYKLAPIYICAGDDCYEDNACCEDNLYSRCCTCKDCIVVERGTNAYCINKRKANSSTMIQQDNATAICVDSDNMCSAITQQQNTIRKWVLTPFSNSETCQKHNKKLYCLLYSHQI